MNSRKAQKGIRLLLEAIGENPDREGLKDTPARVARMYQELTAGLRSEPPKLTTFKEGIEYDQIVLVQDIPFWSLCEHHFALFFGVAHVAYLPGEQKMGLSKAARVVDHFSARPQVQERLTNEVADHLFQHETLKPKGVFVCLVGQHMCMESRGVKKHGTRTTTTALRGEIDKNEVYKMIDLGRRS